MKRESHLGAYGVVVTQGRIVLILKSRGPYVDCWDLPGGRIEAGESPEEALARELEEEIALPMGRAFHLETSAVTVCFRNSLGDPVELRHTGIIFAGEFDPNHPISNGGDNQDAREARWFSFRDAKDLDLTPFARQQIEKFTEPCIGVNGSALSLADVSTRSVCLSTHHP